MRKARTTVANKHGLLRHRPARDHPRAFHAVRSAFWNSRNIGFCRLFFITRHHCPSGKDGAGGEETRNGKITVAAPSSLKTGRGLDLFARKPAAHPASARFQ